MQTPLPTCFRAAALTALTLFAASAGHAQGLGGFLDKANRVGDKATRLKQTIKQNLPASTSQGSQSSQSSQGSQDGQSKNGQAKPAAAPDDERQDLSSDPPSPLTAENQVAYIRTQMADDRPVVVSKSDNSPNYNYRRLRQLAKIAVPFTWDDAAVKVATTQEEPLWKYINTMSYYLVSGLALENGPYLKSALQRVKEIHLTQQLNTHQFGSTWYAFNSSTGVLTVALNVNEEGNGPSSEADLGDWMLKNMTKAPKSRIELENEARFRYAREHPSSISTAPSGGGGSSNGGSSAKSWTCTWCHQSVTAASRPSLAGCPRNTAHQHAWHN